MAEASERVLLLEVPEPKCKLWQEPLCPIYIQHRESVE